MTGVDKQAVRHIQFLEEKIERLEEQLDQRTEMLQRAQTEIAALRHIIENDHD